MAGREPSPEALALLDVAPCGLLQTADDGTILRVNRTFCSWVGLRRRGARRPASLPGPAHDGRAHLPPDALGAAAADAGLGLRGEARAACTATAATIPMVLNALRRERGRRRWCTRSPPSSRATATSTSASSCCRASGSRSWSPKRHRLHAEAKDRALFAEQMIGIVSHDLRNPLSSIQMGAALLAREEPAPSAAAHRSARITPLDRSARNRLIADLLDFTQARLGKGLGVVDRSRSTCTTVVEKRSTSSRSRYPRRELWSTSAPARAQCIADAEPPGAAGRQPGLQRHGLRQARDAGHRDLDGRRDVTSRSRCTTRACPSRPRHSSACSSR